MTYKHITSCKIFLEISDSRIKRCQPHQQQESQCRLAAFEIEIHQCITHQYIKLCLRRATTLRASIGFSSQGQRSRSEVKGKYASCYLTYRACKLFNIRLYATPCFNDFRWHRGMFELLIMLINGVFDLFWANYTQGKTKLSRKSENAVADDWVLKFLYDADLRHVESSVRCHRKYKNGRIKVDLGHALLTVAF